MVFRRPFESEVRFLVAAKVANFGFGTGERFTSESTGSIPKG